MCVVEPGLARGRFAQAFRVVLSLAEMRGEDVDRYHRDEGGALTGNGWGFSLLCVRDAAIV
jgi:hypothetical protein